MFALMLAAHMIAKPIELSAWLVWWDGGRSLASFEVNAHRMSDVCVEWLTVDEEGNAIRRETSTAQNRERVITIAKRHGVRTFAMVANVLGGEFDASPVRKFLETPESRQAHAEALVALAKEDGFDGLDLDYESLPASTRDAFSDFVERCARVCRQEGLLLSIAVHPKESEPGSWDGPMAQDWKRIGAAVDVFRIMTYDFSWSTSEAGPIAPNDWVERVGRFAIANMPAVKVEIGIAAYGYDWRGRQGESMDWSTWQERVRQHGEPTRDPASREAVLRYDDRTAHFSDAEAIRPKMEIARRLGVRGLAMWRLGSEDPALWQVLDEFRRG